MIGKYLDGGGKAMLMLDPETDPQFDELLKGWNIQSADNIVLDVSGVGQMPGAGHARSFQNTAVIRLPKISGAR